MLMIKIFGAWALEMIKIKTSNQLHTSDNFVTLTTSKRKIR